MIRKFVVRAWQLKLRHVAGHTLFFGHRTRFCARLQAGRFRVAGISACVTGEAFVVEVHRLRVEVVVRVVAGEATHARIVRVVAFATREAIRLKADVGNTRVRLSRYLCPGAMTLAAEIGRLIGGEPDQSGQIFRRRSVMIAELHRGKVSLRRLMTVRALHPGN